MECHWVFEVRVLDHRSSIYRMVGCSLRIRLRFLSKKKKEFVYASQAIKDPIWFGREGAVSALHKGYKAEFGHYCDIVSYLRVPYFRQRFVIVLPLPFHVLVSCVLV